MLNGLWQLTWLEAKIFLREPLGAFGSVVLPMLLYVILGRAFGANSRVQLAQAPPEVAQLIRIVAPVLAAIMIGLSAVLSLTTIIAIYREGGILKRLRATPLRPATILTAHVVVKLLFTAVTVIGMLVAGRRYYPPDMHIPIVSFTVALLISTFSILSVGFVIASLVPTARFAQTVGGIIFYPTLALCGLFYPIAALPPALRALARMLPLTYVVSLLTGILRGEGWSAHLRDVGALAIVFLVCTALSARVFRWE